MKVNESRAEPLTMSETSNEVAVSLKELQQVCEAINGGADYYEAQMMSATQPQGFVPQYLSDLAGKTATYAACICAE